MKFNDSLKRIFNKKMSGINILSANEIQIAAEQNRISKRTVIVSIVNPDKAHPSLDGLNCRRINVRFRDTEDEHGINRMQAKVIASFIEENTLMGNPIIVHCESGVSRSAGVAAAIMRFQGRDDMKIFSDRRYNPNMRCYEFMCDAFGITLSKEDIAYRAQLSSMNFCSSWL